MIRRHAVAAVAMVMMSLMTVPAEAGGGGLPTSTSGAVGVKKQSNLRIRNTSTKAYYVVALPDSLAASTSFGVWGSVGWAKKLGGVLVNPGASVLYPVPAGSGAVSIFLPSAISANANDFLPDEADGTTYTVSSGSTVAKTIFAGPVIQ